MDLHDHERQHDRIAYARKFLYARIDRSMFAIIHDDKGQSSASRFSRLQTHYKPESSFAIQLTAATCKDLGEYLNSMRQLRRELTYAGEPMSDTRYIAKLLESLPARYISSRDRYNNTVKSSCASDSSLISSKGNLVHWEYK